MYCTLLCCAVLYCTVLCCAVYSAIFTVSLALDAVHDWVIVHVCIIQPFAH